MIEFLCPNGHRIQCREEQAGRAGKCPRCGAIFRIPGPTEPSESTAARTAENAASVVAKPKSPPPPAAATVAAAPDEPLIEFLCPNGHRLHGPANLQGRPGQCPACGTRFRIPTYEDVDEEENAEVDLGVGRADGTSGSASALPIGEEIAVPEVAGLSNHPASRPTRHPMAALFARLWNDRPPGSTVEVFLEDGATIRPDRFAPAMSQNSHAVFAVAEPSGGFVLSAVAWASVVRVEVHGVTRLPDEMRE